MIDLLLETKSVRLEPKYLVLVQAPLEDVDRILASVVAINPLLMGKYESNSFQTASGLERYRPLEGAAAGVEKEIRRRPGVVEFSFELPRNEEMLGEVVEQVFLVHSYQEPVIRVFTILSSRSKGLDDSKNPNRWWNTTGDWKIESEQAS